MTRYKWSKYGKIDSFLSKRESLDILKKSDNSYIVLLRKYFWGIPVYIKEIEFPDHSWAISYFFILKNELKTAA